MRILIAEDDQVLADGLLRSLRNAGYAVDRVASGSEADAALSSHEFDLVILDLGLPKLHGLDVLRKLRARGAAVPVLILTTILPMRPIKGWLIAAQSRWARWRAAVRCAVSLASEAFATSCRKLAMPAWIEAHSEVSDPRAVFVSSTAVSTVRSWAPMESTIRSDMVSTRPDFWVLRPNT